MGENYLTIVSPLEWQYDWVDIRDVKYEVCPIVSLISTIVKTPNLYSIDDIADLPGSIGKILTMAKQDPHIAGDATTFCQ